ncbi:MAG: cyclopropane fatty acyl phospholipid synthase [Desulfobacteraceae bacterium]|nr:cyclopropane fatty acyl phospholipid synthase [Desulfobacteraceae bacterium]
MNNKRVKQTFKSLMNMAGITVNGSKPYDIQVKNDDFYYRVIQETTIGLGESYMDHWWDCKSLDRFFEKVLYANIVDKVKKDWATVWNIFKSKLFNLQNRRRAFVVGKKHYDIGNDLYERMLDQRMQYTCGYWKDAANLDTAQEAKLDLVCKKLNLEPGMKVIELGCGFGGFAKFAAQRYGAHVTGFTVSKNQAEYGQRLCKNLPVEIRLDDYRKAKGKYERAVSIGLMEHVGYKNYRTYMKLTHKLLKNNGISFVHTIGSNISSTTSNSWTSKYIFPNSVVPSISQLGKAMEGYFVMEDWHNFGEDYDKTLMAWYENFNQGWPQLKNNYSDRFYRMWEYYLLSCAAAFRARSLQLWQIVLTKPGKTCPKCRIS